MFTLHFFDVFINKSKILRIFNRDTFYDCSAGVLHILSKNKFQSEIGNGINAMWKLDCDVPANVTGQHRFPTAMLLNNSALATHDEIAVSTTFHGKQNKDNVDQRQISKQRQQQCFRGVHDNILLPEEIDYLVQSASTLIAEGGDHVTIRSDVHNVLSNHAPDIVSKLKRLLLSYYDTDGVQRTSARNHKPIEITPVAFRFHAAISPLPHTSHESGPANPMLEQLINQTVCQIPYLFVFSHS